MKRKKIVRVALASVFGALSLVALGGCSAPFKMLNYEEWSAQISQSALQSCVCVKKNVSEIGEGGTQGSGVIFYETESSYYALTNNHVVYKEKGEEAWYTVVDCYDHMSSASVVYRDEAYDLAVVVFPKPKKDLSVRALAESNPKKMETVALVSTPSGRHNSVTYGKVRRYATVDVEIVEGYSNVDFEVIAHGCYGENGSSGGGIINERLEIVGVHYACGYDTNGVSVEGYAVPVEKIREFLLTAEVVSGKELGV